MEKMIGLNVLLKHEVMDLYSAEEQIINALPVMIDKAKNNDLKKALQEHLKITEEQKGRLDKVQQLMNDNEEDMQSQEPGEEKKGFFSRLFNGNDGKEKCKGMEGLIDEGQKIMGEDMSPEVLDAAIIASAQKIEHYEISGYGTAHAYAGELKLGEVQKLLEETLNEEYEADDRLTELALKRVNLDAEKTDTTEKQGKAGDKHATEQSERREVPAKKSESKEQSLLLKRKVHRAKLILQTKKIPQRWQTLLKAHLQKEKPIINQATKKIKKVHLKAHKVNQKKLLLKASHLHVDKIPSCDL